MARLAGTGVTGEKARLINARMIIGEMARGGKIDVGGVIDQMEECAFNIPDPSTRKSSVMAAKTMRVIFVASGSGRDARVRTGMG